MSRILFSNHCLRENCGAGMHFGSVPKPDSLASCYAQLAFTHFSKKDVGRALTIIHPVGLIFRPYFPFFGTELVGCHLCFA